MNSSRNRFIQQQVRRYPLTWAYLILCLWVTMLVTILEGKL